MVSLKNIKKYGIKGNLKKIKTANTHYGPASDFDWGEEGEELREEGSLSSRPRSDEEIEEIKQILAKEVEERYKPLIQENTSLYDQGMEIMKVEKRDIESIRILKRLASNADNKLFNIICKYIEKCIEREV